MYVICLVTFFKISELLWIDLYYWKEKKMKRV
jgi:hypothetical protein